MIPLRLSKDFVEVTATSSNSVFAIRFAHSNAFGTSQARGTLGDRAFVFNGGSVYEK
jgi:hypothetical protein